MITLQAKAKLLMGLLRGNKAYTAPFFIKLNLTNQCNLRCLNCPYHSPAHVGSKLPAASMEFDLVRRLSGETGGGEASAITLTGSGEPLLHPQIVEIVEVLKRKGHSVTLYTNGSLLDVRLAAHCDCSNCCFTFLNWQIHRRYKWFGFPQKSVRGFFAANSGEGSD